MTKTITIETRLKAGLKFDKEANIFVAHTPTLDIFSQGETIDRAKLALEDAVKSFLMVAHKNDLLTKCLETTKFMPSKNLGKPGKGAEEYILISEREILEETNYGDIFDIPAQIPLPYKD